MTLMFASVLLPITTTIVVGENGKLFTFWNKEKVKQIQQCTHHNISPQILNVKLISYLKFLNQITFCNTTQEKEEKKKKM